MLWRSSVRNFELALWTVLIVAVLVGVRALLFAVGEQIEEAETAPADADETAAAPQQAAAEDSAPADIDDVIDSVTADPRPSGPSGDSG